MTARSPRLPSRLRRVADRLVARYGRPRRRAQEPLDTLIETMLSQHTSDVNSGRAFASLKAAFPRWELVARAPVAAVERAIRAGGLSRTKSRRIKSVLAAVKRRAGCYDLGHLRRLPPREADAWLLGLPGVGPKTRACVLLFACLKPAFPVDTHVHRIAVRAGLLSPRDSAEAAHARLLPAIPAGRHLELHLNLIRLGRELCRPRAPRCALCPIRRDCDHGRRAA
ncbi:MAG TPA: endonuclease III [Vicinamibacteria bacterium]|nr:endonuclease III [Vicinamibacteria bacterium]